MDKDTAHSRVQTLDTAHSRVQSLDSGMCSILVQCSVMIPSYDLQRCMPLEATAGRWNDWSQSLACLDIATTYTVHIPLHTSSSSPGQGALPLLALMASEPSPFAHCASITYKLYSTGAYKFGTCAQRAVHSRRGHVYAHVWTDGRGNGNSVISHSHRER